MIKLYNPQIIFFMETKLDSNRMEKLHKNDEFVHDIKVMADGTKGCLSLSWKVEIFVKLRSFSSNYIDVEIEGDVDSEKWKMIGFYGSPYMKLHSETWDLLCFLG